MSSFSPSRAYASLKEWVRYRHFLKVDGSDVNVLMALNVMAALVSALYSRSELPLADAFAVFHVVAFIALAASKFFSSLLWLLPVAVGLSASLFVGRALGIFGAWLFGTSPLPGPSLLLATTQWAALAWFLRPRRLTSPDDLPKEK